MNIIMFERIVELSEFKTRHERLKLFVRNWRNVVYLSVGLLTMKIACEQLVMIFIRK